MKHALSTFIQSNKFFYATVVLFALSALWIASASIYPMAFDEEFHYGLLQIYANSWLPYGIEHTRDMAQFGAATGDPSYLFHYLMSFPYRLMDWLSFSDVAIIIVLRVINVAFVVGSLFIFRRAILEGGIRPAIANVSLMLLCLIPVFPMLTGQINYDNLLLLIVAMSVLLTVRITNTVSRKRRFPAKETLLLLIALLFGMSVKYAFLPIAAGLGLWVIGLLLNDLRRSDTRFILQLRSFIKDVHKMTTKTKYAVLTLGILGSFFAAHYVTNTVQYDAPIPDCAVVFDEEACTAYGPWNRNRNYESSRDPSFQPLSYPTYMAMEWLPGMTQRLTFAVAGKTNGFQTKEPLPIVLIVFVAFTIIGIFALIYRFVRARATISRFTWLTLLLCTIYVVALSSQIYGDYVTTGRPVAINGRYLLLLLPLFGAVLVDAISYAARSISFEKKMMATFILFIALAIGGAGVGTYILQADAHWFWAGWGQTSHSVLQSVCEFITIGWRFNFS